MHKREHNRSRITLTFLWLEMKEDPCAGYHYVFADHWCEKKRLFPPWPARRGRRWAWWSRNMSASVGSCRWLDTWWRPIPPETRPHILWKYWCLQEEMTRRVMTGTREDRGGGEAHVWDVPVPPEWSDWALRQKFRHKHSLGISEPCQVLPITQLCVSVSKRLNEMVIRTSEVLFGSMLCRSLKVSVYQRN